MSKAHKNWKKFLLNEEINDLNSLIADAVSQFDDKHPSGRDYELDFDDEQVVEEQQGSDDFSKILNNFLRHNEMVTKSSEVIYDFLKKNPKNQQLNPLSELENNLEVILTNPLKSSIYRIDSMDRILSLRSVFIPLEGIDFNAILLQKKLINYTVEIVKKISEMCYKLLFLPTEQLISYFKVRNAITLFTGASVDTIRNPEKYDEKLADEGMIFSLANFNYRFIHESFRVYNLMLWKYQQFIEYYEKNPNIMKNFLKNGKLRLFDDFGIEKSTLPITDFKTRERILKTHKKYMSEISNMIGEMSPLVKQLENIKEDAIELKSKSEHLEVSVKKDDYVFANKFLKYVAQVSPPILIPPNTKIYRGMAIKKELMEKIYKQIQNGVKNIVFPGKEIASWTVDISQAYGFAESSVFDLGLGKGHSVVIISVPATKGMYVASISEYPSEKEIISGGDVVIESVEVKPGSMYTTFELQGRFI